MKKTIAFAILMMLFSCGKQAEKQTKKKQVKIPDNKLVVTTVNYPLYYFADRIGGDLLDLIYVIPENVDPAYWEPKEDDLKIYQESDLILDNGVGYAGWINKVSLPSSKIVNTTKSVKDELIKSSNKVSHSHGPEGEHEHDTFQIITWLNFKIALAQAEIIRDVFKQKLPEREKELEENFILLKNDLQALDEKMTKKALDLKPKNIIASHPVYQYLSKGYGLHIHSVHFDPDKYPSEKQWKILPKQMSVKRPNVMLWEGRPLEETAKKLKQFNIEIVVFETCANNPLNGDFLSVMNNNIDGLN